MIYSMTAFAQSEINQDFGIGTWEIRSVNHRFLESHIRLPENFRFLEAKVRSQLRDYLQRGKIEINLRLNQSANPHTLIFNQELAGALIKNAQWVIQQTDNGQINPIDVLKWPGVMEDPKLDKNHIEESLMKGFHEAMTSLLAARKREGDKLVTLLRQRLTKINDYVQQIRGIRTDVVEGLRQKFITRIEQAKIEVDENRLEQEIVYLAQKIDIDEELDRLQTHVQETEKILSRKGPCGRRLEFMTQELNREANTLSSKSIHSELTHSAVEIKVLIEQMREQIQNIE